MRSNLLAWFAACCVAVMCMPAAGQTDIDTDLFAGRIIPPSPPTTPAPAMGPAGPEAMIAMITDTLPPGKAKEARYEILLNPVFVDSSTATTGVLTTGVVVPAKRLRATVSYSYIDPDSPGDHLDNYGGAIRWKAWSREGAGLTIIGSHSDTRDVSKKTQAGLVAEFLVTGPLTVGTDLRWARKKSSTAKTEDVVPLVTLGVNLGRVIFGGGYTFRNDVDGENNFEGQVEVPVKKIGSFSGAVSKHGAWRLAFARKFGIK